MNTRLGNSRWVALAAAAVTMAVLLVPAAARAQDSEGPPPRIAAGAPGPGYKLAFGGRLSVGDPGWGTEPGGIAEVGGRVQVLPWLGVGLSYLHLGAGNNEGYDPFGFDALEISSAWHPIVGRWFDPFVQVGALGVLGASGGYMDRETTSRLGVEALAGFDLVRLPFAVGVHARSGFTNHAWALGGLHVELRI